MDFYGFYGILGIILPSYIGIVINHEIFGSLLTNQYFNGK